MSLRNEDDIRRYNIVSDFPLYNNMGNDKQSQVGINGGNQVMNGVPFDVRITAIRKSDYRDLQLLYENPIEHTCEVQEGQTWISHSGEKPEGLCESAWGSMSEFVKALCQGEGNFYDGWMKNPFSAMISCNDGFRPVSFLLERI